MIMIKMINTSIITTTPKTTEKQRKNSKAQITCSCRFKCTYSI